ncbi:MAG: hypothetical protein SOZ82_03700 [Eubacteriales bacterium]|nr:hypothetical protein [Eubacteriales bacterium]
MLCRGDMALSTAHIVMGFTLSAAQHSSYMAYTLGDTEVVCCCISS